MTPPPVGRWWLEGFAAGIAIAIVVVGIVAVIL